MKTFEIESVSILKELYLVFLCSGKTFKDRVCSELGYKNGVFYKRMNTPRHTNLSINDREKVLYLAEQTLKDISFVIEIQRNALNQSFK